MPKEIERKFLLSAVPEEAYRHPYLKILQGYLSENPVVRVRVAENDLGKKGYMTVKGKKTSMTAKEYEYEIPLIEAEEMLDSLTQYNLSKIRYEIPLNELKIELDVFNEIKGLFVAEVEIPYEEYELNLPDFILNVLVREVTEDHDFSNLNLGKNGLAKEKYQLDKPKL